MFTDLSRYFTIKFITLMSLTVCDQPYSTVISGVIFCWMSETFNIRGDNHLSGQFLILMTVIIRCSHNCVEEEHEVSV